MAHCGFEGTAVDDAFSHPLKALKVALIGPRVTGPMAPELPFLYGDGAAATVFAMPVADLKRAARDADGRNSASGRH
jgi:hypothetical protein